MDYNYSCYVAEELNEDEDKDEDEDEDENDEEEDEDEEDDEAEDDEDENDESMTAEQKAKLEKEKQEKDVYIYNFMNKHAAKALAKVMPKRYPNFQIFGCKSYANLLFLRRFQVMSTPSPQTYQ